MTERFGWNFNHSYATLPGELYAEVKPTAVQSPKLVFFNSPLAHDLGLKEEHLAQEATLSADLFSGNAFSKDESAYGAHPLSQSYAGHQFGYFNRLGDGRAILIGEQLTPSGRRFDIQLKGAGPTPYSRRGDGRAALGPMLREVLVSESLFALGIPTTRSLAVVTTGEPVFRETTLPGAVLTRVASSHIRVGTFQFAAMLEGSQGSEKSALRSLADYAIERHDPELLKSFPEASPARYLAFLKVVIQRQARLVSQWLGVGFVHGVLNTDNVTISGESIDFGPCAFLDSYHSGAVFSSIDRDGRYAFGQQPGITQWNLTRFAESILPLLDGNLERAKELASEALNDFPRVFREFWLKEMRRKLGLQNEEDADGTLIEDGLRSFEENALDYTNAFRSLSSVSDATISEMKETTYKEWLVRWSARVRRQPGGFSEEVVAIMHSSNPAVIPRNHFVEEVLRAATQDQNFGPFEEFLNALRRPYEQTSGNLIYRSTPSCSLSNGYRTFCGT
jgi:serine/tyrosine/threonine adenylyltransferase